MYKIQVPRKGPRGEVLGKAIDQAGWPRGLQSSGPLKVCLRSGASWEWFWNTKLRQADLCLPGSAVCGHRCATKTES